MTLSLRKTAVLRAIPALGLALFAASASPVAVAQPPANPDSLAALVRIIADDVARVLESPSGRAGRFGRSATESQRNAWDHQVDEWASKLRAIDGDQLYGRPEWVLHGVLQEGLESNIGVRVCRDSATANRTACYHAQLRSYTTLPLTSDEVTAKAMTLRQSLDDELRPLVQRILGTTDVNDARRQFRSEPRFMAGTREELTRLTEQALLRAKARMPAFFREVPDDTLVVIPEPAATEATMGAPARYMSATADRPASLVLNLYRPEERPAMGAYVAAVHEGYPGHHHQIVLGDRVGAQHPSLAHFQMAGFIEGWGLYSERLADEMGIYPSDLERAWYLAHLSDATLGMLIDPAINTGSWTRAQAVDSMVIVSGRPRWEAENYANRHLATPGQIVTYALGYAEIMRLRDKARRRLGNRFDIKAFHHALLQHGEITLPMLRYSVERWIQEAPTSRVRPSLHSQDLPAPINGSSGRR